MKVTFMKKNKDLQNWLEVFFGLRHKKAKYDAPFQLTSAANVEAVEFEFSQALKYQMRPFLYIQLMTCFAITIRVKYKLEVNQ